MDRFIYGILFLLAVNKPMKQYGDEFMDESDKKKKISNWTYRNQPIPIPQHGRRRSLTGVPSATAA